VVGEAVFSRTDGETTMDLNTIAEGDRLLNHASGQVYVVVHRDDRTIVAARTVSVTNPDEWSPAGPAGDPWREAIAIAYSDPGSSPVIIDPPS
jgi:hypothetical protein